MNILAEVNNCQTSSRTIWFLSMIPSLLVWIDTSLSPHAGDLLKLYGLTAGFILTLYALYTKDIELRQNRRELHKVLISALFAFILQCLAWVLVEILTCKGVWAGLIFLLAFLSYVWALIYFFMRVVVLAYLRVEKFKERSFFQSVKHFPIIQSIVKKIDLAKSKHYETNAQCRISLDKYPSLMKLIGSEKWQHQGDGFSFLIAYKNSLSWIQLIAKFIKEHIENGETITLVACRHHPSHIILYLEKEWENSDQTKLRERLVIIDGFTESFGGDDEIFPKSLKKNSSDGYVIFSASSIPGIHSGCAEAFKHFKKIAKGKRLPSTVIYDGLLIYRHCEAEAFLTRFLVHMIEAERTYSMVTLVGEPLVDVSTASFKSLFSLVDYSCICETMENFSELKYEEGI